jgi:hypothetical protein
VSVLISIAPNTPPTIAAVGVTRTAGNAVSNSTIANINDAEDARNTLAVTVNNGSIATVTGVTVSNLSINAAGVVTADIVAACNASTASFTLKVTDSGGLSNTATLTVTVNANTAPTLTYTSSQTVVASASLTINPATGPSDNGTISSIAVQSQGTYTGTISVNNSTGVVSLGNAAPTGTHTITIRATDNCGAITDSSFTLIVTNQLLQFNSPTYTVGEADGGVTITVTRTGSVASPASVDYKTNDASGLTNCNVNTGNASPRCDFTAVAGTLNFIAGQSSASFDIPIINDVYVEGPETLTITLSNPTGGSLGSQNTATLTITDNDFAPGAANPIDDNTFFIRQQYLDILGREPDPPGLAGWQAFLNNCAAGSTACDRIELSSRFFRSAEFFDRAYYVYRFYETALGRKPTYDEYQDDLKQVSGFLTDAELEAKRAAFAEGFSHRAEFKALYDSKADGDEYVNAIVATAGVVPSNRTNVAIRQGALAITRGQALRELLESPEISAHFFNEAFVVVGYFAYLRREPDAQYLVWLNTLNTTGDYREMIRGFIESQEYRHRFGP